MANPTKRRPNRTHRRSRRGCSSVRPVPSIPLPPILSLTPNPSDPLRLSHFLLDQSLSHGVHLHHPAEPTKLLHDHSSGALTGLELHSMDSSLPNRRIPCTHLLFTAGAWTSQIFARLFPSAPLRLPISSLAGHSLVVRSPKWCPSPERPSPGCHAVFTTTSSGLSPEIFSRVGGEIYVAGLNDASLPLPARPTDAVVDPGSLAELRRVAERFLGEEEDGDDGMGENGEMGSGKGKVGGALEVVREGLCFRPVTPRGQPVVGEIGEKFLGVFIKGKEEGGKRGGGKGGVYVAAGHGPWGISLSLGTGKVMAEMMGGEELSADVRGLGL